MMIEEGEMKLGSYRQAIVSRALPFWAEHGFDGALSRFHERLDTQGRPIDVPHRSMVQARQIYVFAHAAKLGWFPGGAALAERAMRNLVDVYARHEGGQTFFIFSADAQAKVVSPVRDAYAHAFVLFAIASVYELNGDRRLLDLADRTIAFVDDQLWDGTHGGLFDALPLVESTKRQNPLMHLLEAYLFLHSAASERGYLNRAGRIVALFQQRLFNGQLGILPEYFAEDLQPHADIRRAAIFEPGHHFEWVWLLDRFRALGGSDQATWVEALHRSACENGFAANGLIFDEVDASFQPVKRSHRVWPHTEAIKAAVARHAGGDAAAADLAEAMAGKLLDIFLDRPFAGGWIDHVDENGAPLVEYVPASSLYHLFLAATEAVKIGKARPSPHGPDLSISA